MRALRFRPGEWAVLGLLVVFGCAHASPQSSDAGSNFDNLEVADAGLKEKLAVLRVGSQVAENNLLSVFAGLKNKTARRLALEVETIYKDKEGNALNDGSWIAFTLKPHEEKDYRSASITEQAVDFIIRVRRAPASAAPARK